MTDTEWEHTQMFAKEFAQLVRKYMPEYPTTDAQADMLADMQDSTSCFSPYVWRDEFAPKK